jgi:hypothetical protein
MTAAVHQWTTAQQWLAYWGINVECQLDDGARSSKTNQIRCLTGMGTSQNAPSDSPHLTRYVRSAFKPCGRAKGCGGAHGPTCAYAPPLQQA